MQFRIFGTAFFLIAHFLGRTFVEATSRFRDSFPRFEDFWRDKSNGIHPEFARFEPSFDSKIPDIFGNFRYQFFAIPNHSCPFVFLKQCGVSTMLRSRCAADSHAKVQSTILGTRDKSRSKRLFFTKTRRIVKPTIASNDHFGHFDHSKNRSNGRALRRSYFALQCDFTLLASAYASGRSENKERA